MSTRNFYIPATSAARSLSYSVPAEPLRANSAQCPTIVNTGEMDDESTPLMARPAHQPQATPFYDQVLIVALVVLFICGTSFGVYLLFDQYQGGVIEEFDLVSREAWGLNRTFLNEVPELVHPISKVLLLRLSTNCTIGQRIEQFQEAGRKEVPMVEFNFYQDVAGRIFEGRGFNFQADCHLENCEHVLAVAVLGQGNAAPSSRLVLKLKAFLDYAVGDQMLQPCYKVMARHFDEMAFMLKKMLKEDGSCKYYY